MENERAGKKTPTMSLVVPVYGTPDLLDRLLGQLDSLAETAADCGLFFEETVIVDDGSSDPDDMRSVVERRNPSSPVPIRLLRHEENAGKGAAVATGMRNAHGDFVLMSDCDMAAPFPELKRLASAMTPEVWLVCGSRAGRGCAARNVPFCRYLLSRLFRVCIRLAGIRDVVDTQCGFKLFRRADVLPVFAGLRTSRFAFDVEVIAEIERRGGRVSETSVAWRGGSRSTLRIFRDAPRMLWDVLLYSFSSPRRPLPSAAPRLSVRWPIALLLVLAAARLAVMATSSVFETSEARYAAITKNMADSGDYLVPRFIYQGRKVAFDGKPPLYFQLGALACRALPSNPDLAVRLPAFGAAVIVVLILYSLVRRMNGRADAWRTAATVAATPVFFLAAGFCLTDMLLAASVVAAWAFWYRFDRSADDLPGRRPLWLLAVFFALGVGMDTKGPVALALFGLPVLAWTIWRHRWHTLRGGGWGWFAGAALFVAMTTPWFVLREMESPGFCSYFFLQENLLRFLRHDYGDRFGSGREFFRGMAIVWVLVGVVPWLPAALRRRTGGEKDRGKAERDRLVSFAWCCVATVTGFWCLTSRVPMLYLLPVLPMAAMAVALSVRTRFLDTSLVASTALLVTTSVVAPLVGERFSSKMPRRFFERLSDRSGGASEVAFAGRCPYSAEFYLGERVTQDDDDPIAYRLCRSDSLDEHPEYAKDRVVLESGCGWTLLSPSLGREFAQERGSRGLPGKGSPSSAVRNRATRRIVSDGVMGKKLLPLEQ